MSRSKTYVVPGDILAGRYRITSEIGRGGFGTVYLAQQLNVDRDVAIKVLPPKFMSIPDVVERFKREATLSSRLQHPNTITIHDYGQHDNSLFIVMEYLRGEDLADVLRRERTLGRERIKHIARQVLKSLAEAHEHGIVHRDLKPENIFLTRVGDDDDVVKVLDFGIAKLAVPEGTSPRERKLTMTGSTVGTPVYMSPEQAAGEEVNAQTDLYALGVIMYEMACGTPPFHDDSPVKVMRAHLFEEIPPLSERALHGSALERVILKALQKEQPLRYQTAREMMLALHAQGTRLAGVPIGIMSMGAPRTDPRPAPTPSERTHSDFAHPTLRLSDDLPSREEPAPPASAIVQIVAPPPNDEDVILLTHAKEVVHDPDFELEHVVRQLQIDPPLEDEPRQPRRRLIDSTNPAASAFVAHTPLPPPVIERSESVSPDDPRSEWTWDPSSDAAAMRADPEEHLVPQLRKRRRRRAALFALFVLLVIAVALTALR
ncbi:MAG: protein kinase [Myxococcota bacterium]